VFGETTAGGERANVPAAGRLSDGASEPMRDSPAARPELARQRASQPGASEPSSRRTNNQGSVLASTSRRNHGLQSHGLASKRPGRSASEQGDNSERRQGQQAAGTVATCVHEAGRTSGLATRLGGRTGWLGAGKRPAMQGVDVWLCKQASVARWSDRPLGRAARRASEGGGDRGATAEIDQGSDLQRQASELPGRPPARPVPRPPADKPMSSEATTILARSSAHLPARPPAATGLSSASARLPPPTIARGVPGMPRSGCHGDPATARHPENNDRRG
jgi:hypothetical protein